MRPIATLLLLITGTARAAAPDWIPNDVMTVLSMRGPSFLERFVEGSLGKAGTPPACVGELMKQIDQSYMLWRSDGSAATDAMHLPAEREAVERCAADAFAKLGGPLEIRRSGAISELKTSMGTAYAGFGKGGWIFWDSSRSHIEALLSSAPEKPRLAWLTARVPADAQAWAVTDMDYTHKLLGVPSRGGYFAGTIAPGQMPPFTVVFASPAEAKRALQAIGKASRNAKYSLGLRALIATFKPKQRGAELDMRLDLLADPGGFEKLQPLMAEIQALMAAR
jgi:hypothetical protein